MHFDLYYSQELFLPCLDFDFYQRLLLYIHTYGRRRKQGIPITACFTFRVLLIQGTFSGWFSPEPSVSAFLHSVVPRAIKSTGHAAECCTLNLGLWRSHAPVLRALMWCLLILPGGGGFLPTRTHIPSSDSPSMTHCLQCRGVTVVLGSHQE